MGPSVSVAVLAENRPGERRVALVPEVAGRLRARGFRSAIAAGAGRRSFFHDALYKTAAIQVKTDPVDGAEVLLSVRPPAVEIARRLGPGTLTISFLPVREEGELIRVLRDRGVTALALDLLPRISRAQSMDALTSQALVVGYRGALVAAERLPRFLPGLHTAAGTLPPARVLVLGAGVAGLQAIATARRLGAQVAGYDVRVSSAEEIRSVGAAFLDLGLDPLQGAAGYARRLDPERAARQQDLLAPHVAAADALITAAAVPGQDAPVLVTRAMVEAMRPGSVVVDLAAEAGGNVEGVRAGAEQIVSPGVLLWGGAEVASQLPTHASRMFAHNVVSLLDYMGPEGVRSPDLTDEIVGACWVTHDGKVRR
ncbi:MAG TPA: NAD(P) transhydrogenase subunit alpha [Sporichthya sp.]|nr:NAD(P) transhydrogenase subunit alpha [Sporichthya sp.]